MLGDGGVCVVLYYGLLVLCGLGSLGSMGFALGV